MAGETTGVELMVGATGATLAIGAELGIGAGLTAGSLASGPTGVGVKPAVGLGAAALSGTVAGAVGTAAGARSALTCDQLGRLGTAGALVFILVGAVDCGAVNVSAIAGSPAVCCFDRTRISSMRSRRLYLVTRSPRDGAPNLT